MPPVKTGGGPIGSAPRDSTEKAPDVNLDVGHAEALLKTAILVVTKQLTAEERARLNGYGTAIIERAEFDPHHFAAEVWRATSNRPGVA
jgi:hypothetical protein